MKELFNQMISWGVVVLFIVLGWISVPNCTAVEIKIGGSKKLDLSSHERVYWETFDSTKSPDTIFGGGLGIGEKTKPPWRGELTGEAYSLTHSGNPGALRYYYMTTSEDSPRTLSEHPISVEIEEDSQGKVAGAGLLYGFTPATKEYLAFVLGAEKSYAIYRRDGTGLNRIINGTSPAISRQANTIAIAPNGTSIDFYINGTHISEIDNGVKPTGGVGILAISPGLFSYDNFTIYTPQAGDKVVGEVTVPKQAPVPIIELPKVLQRSRKPTAPKVEAPAPQSQQPVTKTKPLVPPPQEQPGQDSTLNNSQFLQPGTSKAQVVKNLGRPTYMRGGNFFYTMEKAESKQVTTLVVQFDEQDKVVAHKTIVQ